MTDRPDLDALADDLRPVRPIRPWSVAAIALLAAMGGGMLVIGLIGVRTAYGASFADPIFVLRAGLLALLAIACLVSIARMARPSLGSSHGGWRWALAAAGIVPLAAVVVAIADGVPLSERMHMWDGMECLRWSLGIALATGAALTLWLRCGAPVYPERAGWLVGLAAGSLGAFAYALHCPHDDIVYIAIWNVIALVAAAVIGRLAVPHAIRW